MTGGREEASADQPAPETVIAGEEFRGKREVKIEDLEFVRRANDLGDMRPSAGDLMKNDEEAEDRAGDVQEHLNHVGPDHSRQAAFERVKQGEANDYDDGDHLARSEDGGNDNGDGKNAHSFGEHSQQ